MSVNHILSLLHCGHVDHVTSEGECSLSCALVMMPGLHQLPRPLQSLSAGCEG